MWKSIVSIVIALVLLGLLVGGGLLYHDTHPPQTNQTPLPSNVTLARIAQWNDLTVQSNAWKAGTQAANDYAKKFNATNDPRNTFYDIHTETHTNQMLMYTNTVTLDTIRTFYIHWVDPKTYRLFSYLTAYLNAGGDPNYIIHNGYDAVDAAILTALLRGELQNTIRQNSQYPFFPKPLMHLITLLHDKGYTNWSYTSDTIALTFLPCLTQEYGPCKHWIPTIRDTTISPGWAATLPNTSSMPSVPSWTMGWILA